MTLAKIRIHHRTTYRYTLQVNPGPHRLMVRPREGRELRLLSNEITIVPDAELTWALDVSGNAIATATFACIVDALTIDAVTELQLSSKAWPIFPIAASAINYPFLYADDEWTDLGALAIQQIRRPRRKGARLGQRLCRQQRDRHADTLEEHQRRHSRQESV
jgi:hypothetical protein